MSNAFATNLVLTDEQIATAISLAADGKGMEDIHITLGVASWELYKYRKSHPFFEKILTEARQEGFEQLADTLIEIPDVYADVQRGRLKSDNIKWLLSKRKPLVYGDRIDVNLTQTIDIGVALSEARSRALNSATARILDCNPKPECPEFATQGVKAALSHCNLTSGTFSGGERLPGTLERKFGECVPAEPTQAECESDEVCDMFS